MSDLISRQAAIDAVEFGITYAKAINKETGEVTVLFEESNAELQEAADRIKQLPPAQPDIIRCKDCKFYSPMNRETKTGICNLIMHQNFGDNWFCAGAERRTDG